MITGDLATQIQDAILSHASATGHFDSVAGHTPKNAPGLGLSAAITLGRVMFVAGRSGLASTTLRLEWRLELFRPMESTPDDIDPTLAAATIAVMGRLSADLTLGDLVDEIPLLGANGSTGMFAEQRYVKFADGGQYRQTVITVPTVHDDVLTQSRSS
jgi:hypothetical protein